MPPLTSGILQNALKKACKLNSVPASVLTQLIASIQKQVAAIYLVLILLSRTCGQPVELSSTYLTLHQEGLAKLLASLPELVGSYPAVSTLLLSRKIGTVSGMLSVALSLNLLDSQKS